METAVQTPPSYAGEGTGSRRDPHSGPSGSSSNNSSSSSSGLAHHRRQQALAARGPPSTAGGSGRTRGGPADGGGTGGSSRKRPAKTGVSFEPDSANTSNGNGPHEATVAHCGKSKRRKRQHPDLKFMLGGSITDPLNLRSLENEEENRRANQTPVPSPAPAGGGGSERVEVIIPRDINDPLNLNAPEPQPGVPASVPGAGAVSGETLTAQQHQQKQQQPHTEHQQPKQQQLQQNHQQQQQQHHHQQQQQQQQPQQQQGSFTDRRRNNNNTRSNDNYKPLQPTAFKRSRRRRNRYQHQARMAIAAGWRGQGGGQGEVSFRDGWNSTTTARAGPSTDSTHCGGGATIPGSAASGGRRGTRNNPQRQQLSANEGSSSSTSNTHQSQNNSINKGNNNNSNDKSKPDNHGSNSGIKNNRNSAGGSSSSINNNNNNNKSDIRNGTDNSCNKSNSNNDNNNSNNNNNNKNRSGSANSSSNQRFRFGNYNRYYGYRNGADGDSRLPLLQREWFEGNVCLDIGCNVGHVTLSVARDFAPKEMIGIDIDPALIRIAKKNVRHYMHEGNTHGNWFPESCALTFGPISMGPASAAAAAGRAASTQNNTGAGVGCGIGSAGFGGASPPDPVDDGRTSRRSTCRRTGSCNDVRDSSGAGGGPSRTLLSETAGLSRPDENAAMKRPQSLCRGAPTFPYNVFFSETNYVLENDEQLETQQEQFDTIMCLSTSKWIQLNFGDAGLKRAFRRVFRQLRPGGLFVFEPQPLSSYRKFCAPEHRENFRRMQLKPDDFPDFLIREVGFASCEILGVGSHGSKNFQRPVYLLRKGKQQNAGGEHKDSSRARSCASDDANPSKGDTASQNSNDSKGECGKNPSTSTKITAESHEQSPSASDSALRPSPAHECDTTTASI